MKVVSILFLSLFSLLLHRDIENRVEVEIKEGSHLYIKGTSNVNRFTCDYLKPIKPNSFTLSYEDIKNGWIIEDAQLQLESTSFDCGGRRINKDFEELVKSSQFPSIQIEVFEIIPEKSKLQANIKVSIAGVTKSLPVFVTLEKGEDITYTSVLKLNIEDFNLDTPTKMMGLIKVHEEISIHVNLRLGLSVKS
ncbi:YceI family protein [Psychroflexus salinarum]|uniref:YceI family protein n=1 Tax=Psychroflexus salinarum TaxID=546024 RepID=A0ABW3GSF4_9FLAO